jgi:hypothetical protein
MVIPALLLGGMLSIATPFTSQVNSQFTSQFTSANSSIATLPEDNIFGQTHLDVDNPGVADPTDRLFLANITNPQDARDFLEQMRSAATTLDPEALAGLVHYPFVTYNNGRIVKTYATPAELLLDFEQIFTTRVITAMRNAQYSELFVNSQGAMISNGTIWFFQYSEGIKIKAINDRVFIP